MTFGLPKQTTIKIQNVFSQFSDIEKAVIYGSRAKGTWKKGSDIDLTLFGRDLDHRQCSVIADALDDLLLPYMIDLSVYALLDHEDLKAHIDRVGQVFYEKS